MEQNKKTISQYDKFKRNFRNTVDKNEKTRKIKLILIAVGIFLLAVALILCATLIEKSNEDMLVYYFGDTEQKIKVEGDVQLIDFVALADYCGMTKSINSPNASFEINGTKASFINGSKTAKINGFDLEMPCDAAIKNGYCLVPLSIVEQVFSGILITKNGDETTIIMEGNIYMLLKDIEPQYETDVSKYLEYINSKDKYIFTLANKENILDRNFPENQDDILVEIPEKYRTDTPIKLHYIAEKALEAMMNDMFFVGYTNTDVTSAYRSYEYQEWLFNDYVKKEQANGLSESAAINKVLTYSSEPGKSEHQTGLCVDFFIPSVMDELENYGHEGKYKNDVGFAETEVFAWLKENCWKYGFILRYPEDKVDITGYSYESWHYRFVGFEVASIIHQTGLCYEEYLEIFANK